MKESSSIYVSSSCVRSETIADSVRTLSDAGFCAIELSGGTKPYEDMERDLLELKQSRNLEYRPHNYFPPPQTPFVLNLASDDEAVSTQSMDLVRNALRLCKLLGSKKFGFHAGFFMDIRCDFRVENHLSYPFPVTQIHKNNTAVVSPALDPTHKDHLAPLICDGELAAVVALSHASEYIRHLYDSFQSDFQLYRVSGFFKQIWL